MKTTFSFAVTKQKDCIKTYPFIKIVIIEADVFVQSERTCLGLSFDHWLVKIAVLNLNF